MREWVVVFACSSLAACESGTGDSGTDDSGWKEIDSGTTEQLDAIWGTSASDIWAVGHAGIALHHDGARWTSVPTPTSDPLLVLWGASPDRYWAGGIGLYVWDGAKWTPEPGFAEVRVGDIHGSGPDDVWVTLAYEAELRHWDGSSWTTLETPDGEYFDHIVAAGPNDVWATGSERGVYHFNGVDWTFHELPDVGGASFWTGLSACATDDVWVIGGASSVSGGAAVAYRWDGTTWTETHFYDDPILAPGVLAGVSCRAANDVWMVGGSGAYRGDGNTWTPIETQDFLLAVWAAPDSREVWAVGSVGALVRGTSP